MKSIAIGGLLTFGIIAFTAVFMCFVRCETQPIPVISEFSDLELLEENPPSGEMRIRGFLIQKNFFPMGLYPSADSSMWDPEYVMPGIKIRDKNIMHWPSTIPPVEVVVTCKYEKEKEPKASFGIISEISNLEFAEQSQDELGIVGLRIEELEKKFSETPHIVEPNYNGGIPDEAWEEEPYISPIVPKEFFADFYTVSQDGKFLRTVIRKDTGKCKRYFFISEKNKQMKEIFR